MNRLRFVLVVLLPLLIMSGCGRQKLPSRDQIPVLRGVVYNLEKALKEKDRTCLDSLLSVDILDRGEDSDSLLRFVYGSDGSFPFMRLGNYEIFYSTELAVVDCYIMDSTEQTDRPLRLNYKFDDGLWLLREFAPGPLPLDSADSL